MSTATLHASVSADEAEILALGAALHKAHFDKDSDGIAAPFAPHATSPPISSRPLSPAMASAWNAIASGLQRGTRRLS